MTSRVFIFRSKMLFYGNIIQDIKKSMPYTYTIRQGNLLNEEDATFIVNASNTTLILSSGVSGAFRGKCGNFMYALHAMAMDYNAVVASKEILPSVEDIDYILINIELYLQWYTGNHPDESIRLVLTPCELWSRCQARS